MATYYAGNSATIDIGSSTDLPGLISYTLPETRARIDVTTAGNDREAFILGIAPGTATADCYLDTSVSALESAVTSGSTLTVTFKVDGDTLDTFTAYVTRSVNTQGPSNQAVKATYTFINAA